MLLKTVLLVVLTLSSALAQGGIYVTIPNGQIKGRQDITYSNKTFYAFQEIPYAKPPTGTLRFKAPEPVEDWGSLLDATTNTKICYQLTPQTDFTETEDCLYVNVYTPVDPSSNASLPVMFYVFGGGFLNGHAAFKNFGPHYFIEQDVVVVTVNYRIGPFGFVATGDTVMPGNMGLKDQNLGLKWVQKNIQYFGGDPSKVTIFGLSAGGASVSYHMLSKQSEGLFRGVISESGSALCPWAYQRNYKSVAYNMATYLDPTFSQNATSQELLTLLQSVTAAQILATTNSALLPWGVGRDQMVQGFVFTPIIEPEHEGAFLTQNMYEVVASGGASPVPLMIGIMSEEQINKAENLNNFKSELAQYDQSPGALVNDNMHLADDASKTAAGEAIRKIYTDGELQNDVAAGVKYFSDTSFSRPIIHNAKLHSSFNDVYFFQFSYHGDQVTWNNVIVEGCGRVSHSEDSAFLWGYQNNGNIEQWGTARDILMTRRYVQLFTNFAKELNPTPEESDLFQGVIWPTVTPTKFQYLDIDDDLTVKTDPKGDAYTKWVEVYESLAVKPYDTF